MTSTEQQIITAEEIYRDLVQLRKRIAALPDRAIFDQLDTLLSVGLSDIKARLAKLRLDRR